MLLDLYKNHNFLKSCGFCFYLESTRKDSCTSVGLFIQVELIEQLDGKQKETIFSIIDMAMYNIKPKQTLSNVLDLYKNHNFLKSCGFCFYLESTRKDSCTSVG